MKNINFNFYMDQDGKWKHSDASSKDWKNCILLKTMSKNSDKYNFYFCHDDDDERIYKNYKKKLKKLEEIK